uniref:Protein m119.2 n=1 Tax=Mastomys natalensis cytomegalovirus 1 TaxID=2973541 RepID=A0A9Y1ILS0_9BETA|nr:protein m119.2 [Mastomys natalensis cytomegalovirus 1]WEG68970.1 protein m119.2 [Mastomys natalensis cytomegalovirus 1]WEG71198.1 protein m119.2 [Mastomys natalensis cytomegalovirus 1]
MSASNTTFGTTSLVIFDIVIAATSDELQKTLVLLCCMTAVVVMLAIIAARISKMRALLAKLARRIGLIEQYQVYTVCEDKSQKCDGTESTTGDFQYASM